MSRGDLTIPQLPTVTTGSTGFDCQTIVSLSDLKAMQATETGTGVVTGCTVTKKTPAAMKVAVAAGTVCVTGKVLVYAGGTVTITAATTHDRRDIICVFTTAGTVKAAATKGAACGTATWNRTSTGFPPMLPAIPATRALVAEVTVRHSTTSIVANNIVDKRCLLWRNTGSYVSGHFYGLPGGNPFAPTWKVIYFQRVTYEGPFTVNQLIVKVGTAHATTLLRFAIYADNGKGRPGKLIVTLGTVPGTTTATRRVTAHTRLLPPGPYHLAVCRQGTYSTGTFKVAAVTNTLNKPAVFAFGPSGSTTPITVLPTFGWKTTAATYTGALPTTAPATLTAITTPGAMVAITARSA